MGTAQSGLSGSRLRRRSIEHLHLVQATILLFLSLDVLPDRLLVPTHRGRGVSTGPEVLSCEIPPAPPTVRAM
jgi:hypothetical protein